MSMLVAHVEKFKSVSVRGMQIHNQREADPENSKNQDIDTERTPLNYDLKNEEHINFQREVKDIMKDGYNGEKAVRHDATMLVSVLVSSDKEFFQKLDDQQQRKFFETAAACLSEKYGPQNVVTATVHMDEATPHMHFQFVPLTDDGRLCAKEITNRKGLLELQKDLPKVLQEAGFDIRAGETKKEKARHKDSHQWKQEQLIAKEIELATREKSLEVRENDVNMRTVELLRIAVTERDVNIIKDNAREKTGFMGKSTDEVILKKSELTMLHSTSVVGAVAREENNRLRKEIDNLTKDKRALDNTRFELQGENAQLKDKLKITETLLRDPKISERVYELQNPDMAAYNKYKKELGITKVMYDPAKSYEEVAYRMGKQGFEFEEIRNALHTDLNRDDAWKAISGAGDRIEQDRAKAEIAQRLANQKAEMNRAVEKVKLDTAEHQQHVEKNPNIKTYLSYRDRGMNDSEAVFRMKNIDKISEYKIRDAIIYSGQSREYASSCVSAVNRIKLPTKTEFKKGRDSAGVSPMDKINSQLKQTQDRLPAPSADKSPTSSISYGGGSSGGGGGGSSSPGLLDELARKMQDQGHSMPSGGGMTANCFPIDEDELEKIEQAMERQGMSFER